MNLAAKITTGFAVLAVGGLVALAAPAIAAMGRAAHGTAEGVSHIAETLEASAEPAAEEPTREPTPRDDLQAAAWAAGCDDFVRVGVYVNGEKPSPRPDRGPSEYASGTVTFKADGGVDTYTVAEGDAGASIGERFCVEYMTMFIRNGVQQGTVHPGQVLKINP